MGTLEVRGPQVWDGSFFTRVAGAAPADGAGRKSDVQEAYIQGAGTRRVDELVPALGRRGISAPGQPVVRCAKGGGKRFCLQPRFRQMS